MDLKSPLTKRQKLTKTTFNDVRDELNQLALLRKNAEEIMDDMFSGEATERLRFLSNIQVEYAPTDAPTVPDVDGVFQSLEEVLKQKDEMVKKQCNHMMLLDTFEQKRRCSIAKIIDEI